MNSAQWIEKSDKYIMKTYGRYPIVPVRESRRMIEAVRKAGGEPLYTEYPMMLHNIWNVTYANPAMVLWVLSRRRGRVQGHTPSSRGGAPDRGAVAGGCEMLLRP